MEDLYDEKDILLYLSELRDKIAAKEKENVFFSFFIYFLGST